jgi:hypothetical protein
MITPRTRLAPLLTPLLGLAMATAVLSAPGAAAATSVALTDCASSDNGKPVVSSFQLGAHSADVRTGDARIPVTVVVEDTGGPGPATGVERVVATLTIPGSRDTQHAFVAGLLAPTGDGRTWQGSITLPPGVASGAWSAGLTVADKAYAEVVLGPDELRAMGSDPAVTVTSAGTDASAPALKTLNLSRKRVDTRNAARRVTVTVRATDASAGVSTVVARARAKHGLREAKTALRLVAGTRSSGTWRGSLVIPRWAGNSSWRLTAHLGDRLHNTTTLRAAELARHGQTSVVTVRSRSDRAAPRATDIRISPSTLDVRDADGVLGVSAKVTDAGSGLGTAFAYALTSEEDAFASVRMHRISGTRYAGRWAGQIEVKRCLSGYRPPSGDVSFGVLIELSDRAGRFTEAGSPRFRARFRDNDWPGVGAILRPTGAVDVPFYEDVVANGTWNPRMAARGSAAEVLGTWTCTNAAGATVSCDLDPFRTAHFTPVLPIALGTTYDVTVNREHTLHVVDLAGNPVVAPASIVMPTG